MGVLQQSDLLVFQFAKSHCWTFPPKNWFTEAVTAAQHNSLAF
jgi:hypothetical protein